LHSKRKTREIPKEKNFSTTETRKKSRQFLSLSLISALNTYLDGEIEQGK